MPKGTHGSLNKAGKMRMLLQKPWSEDMKVKHRPTCPRLRLRKKYVQRMVYRRYGNRLKR